MNIADNIRIAVFSIKTNLMRSLLTMLGIMIGVASVIAIVTVGDGGRDYIVGKIKALGGTTAVSITVNSDASSSDYVTGDDLKAISTMSGVRYVSPVVFGMGSVQSRDQSGIGMLIGGNADIQYMITADTKYGRFFTQEEYDAGKNVAVIDSTSALIMFGEEDVVGQTISYTYESKTVTLKIVGVMDLMSAFGNMSSSDYLDSVQQMAGSGGSGAQMSGATMLVPAPVYNAVMGSGDKYMTVYIQSQQTDDLDSVGSAALNLLYARHNNYDRQVYTMTNMASLVSLLDDVIRIFTLFIAAVGAISLLVGGIGVMNIMLVSVTERTREIGIRKALGAKTKQIMFQFLTESVIICLFGGIVGLILGVSGAMIVSAVMNIPLTVKVSTVLLAVGFSSAIGIFFGIYPARRAAKLPPIEALRRE